MCGIKTECGSGTTSIDDAETDPSDEPEEPGIVLGCLGTDYEEYEGCSCDTIGITDTFAQLKAKELATDKTYGSLDFSGWKAELAECADTCSADKTCVAYVNTVLLGAMKKEMGGYF